MKKSKYGSYVIGRFELFVNVGFWHWRSYNIGACKVYRFGPVQLFVLDKRKKLK